MENEHREVPERVVPCPEPTSSLFASVVSVIALVSIGAQLVLLLKSILIDQDVAIAGFSLFFLAIFGLAYYLTLKRASSQLVFYSGIACSFLCGAAGSIAFILLSASMEICVTSPFVLICLMGGVCMPSIILSKGTRHE